MHWVNKFKCAFQGLRSGVVGQSSFYVHIPATLVVPLMAYLLNCSHWQWCVLGLCVGLVWALELCNSAIEHLARGLCKDQNNDVGKALDTASAAVLVGALTALGIGLSIFVYQLLWMPLAVPA
jgi:diacylglycerol kinase (ATP)